LLRTWVGGLSAVGKLKRNPIGKLSMSKTSLVLTILGQDRPGLIDSLAQVVAEHGGNWVESRMAHLAGQFAGILRVEVAAEQAEPLTEALKNLAGAGLESVVQRDLAAPVEGLPPLVLLSLVGQDRPGIIREVSQVLAAHGVNVEELNTKCTNAPNTGQALFRATARLRLPAHISAEALRKALEQVAADMMVDITLD
jgi:glycine cleavage system regulatory protein